MDVGTQGTICTVSLQTTFYLKVSEIKKKIQLRKFGRVYLGQIYFLLSTVTKSYLSALPHTALEDYVRKKNKTCCPEFFV